MKEQKQKLVHEHQALRQAQSIQRSKTLSSLPVGLLFNNELGTTRGHRLDNRASLLAFQLRGAVAFPSAFPTQAVEYFDIHPATGYLAAGYQFQKDRGYAYGFGGVKLEGSPPRYSVESRTYTPVSQPSSINFTPRGFMVCTTYGGAGQPPEILIESHWIDTLRRVDYRFKLKEDTCFGSALRSDPQCHELVALATSSGIRLIFSTDCDWNMPQIIPTQSDVLSVGWTDNNTMVGGLRNGKVMLFDLRSRNSIMRLAHPGAVTAIKTVSGPHELAVCGTKNSLCLYDLRSTRAIERKKCSQPSITFEGFQGGGAGTQGMEVIPDTDLLAVANNKAGIDVYSHRTGALLQELDDLKCPNCLNPQMEIKCIRCVDDGDGGKKLVAVRRYDWLQWRFDHKGEPLKRVNYPCKGQHDPYLQ